NGTGPTPLVNVYFYADAGGLPGTELYFYDSIATFTDASGDLTVDLSASPAILTAGTYWVSVQADMDFSAGGQWGWLERTVQSNSESAWRNPSDGFGTGCTSWTSRSGCGVGSEPDLSFQLLGSIGGDPPCSTASDIPWLSASPTSGTTPGGGASAVQVTFDSTGLSAGTYTGSLCVGSNDPDEPVVAVPVTMTVSSSVCPILTPIEPPVIIPPGGGGFSFSLDLINNTGQNQSVDLWLLVTLPTGETVQVKEIFNPTLPPGTTTYQGDQGVPGELSAGTYQYTAHVGSYPTSWCESGFSFVKTGATSMTPRDARQGWELRLRLSSGERPR
ncbi:MAG: hypothetical protein ACE5GO_10295, partial [Anaerolineales bacterium]